MTRRETIADIAKAARPGENRGTRRQGAVAAAARPAKKTASIAAKAPRRPARANEDDDAALRERLALAEARVKELEARLAAVADRIAWMADRLHSLIEGER